MENTYQQEKSFGWDDTITQDAGEYILLPDGDYDFVVESFERARFDGSEKMPACNQAILKIKINSDLGSTTINHNLLLHTKTEWTLSAFFAAIGQKKKGEPLKMNWQLVPGSRGRCKLGHKLYNGSEYNEIKKFLPQEDKQSYTPGQF